MVKWFIPLLSLLSVAPGQATTVPSLYFDLPAGWICKTSTEHATVCSADEFPNNKIVLVTSDSTPGDSLEKFKLHLSEIKLIPSENAEPSHSRVDYTQAREINGTIWIDSMQHDSEVAGYATRYLATRIDADNRSRSLLVSIIAPESTFTKLQPVLRRLLQSLRPIPDLGNCAQVTDPIVVPPVIAKFDPFTVKISKEIDAIRVQSVAECLVEQLVQTPTPVNSHDFDDWVKQYPDRYDRLKEAFAARLKTRNTISFSLQTITSDAVRFAVVSQLEGDLGSIEYRRSSKKPNRFPFYQVLKNSAH